MSGIYGLAASSLKEGLRVAYKDKILECQKAMEKCPDSCCTGCFFKTRKEGGCSFVKCYGIDGTQYIWKDTGSDLQDRLIEAIRCWKYCRVNDVALGGNYEACENCPYSGDKEECSGGDYMLEIIVKELE